MSSLIRRYTHVISPCTISVPCVGTNEKIRNNSGIIGDVRNFITQLEDFTASRGPAHLQYVGARRRSPRRDLNKLSSMERRRSFPYITTTLLHIYSIAALKLRG